MSKSWKRSEDIHNGDLLEIKNTLGHKIWDFLGRGFSKENRHRDRCNDFSAKLEILLKSKT